MIHGWLAALLAVVLVLVLAVAALLVLPLRRQWLSRDGGVFECSLRLRTRAADAGWVLGMARYNAELLQWYRFFSYSIRPRKSLVRSQVRVIRSRTPDQSEARNLFVGQRIIELEITDQNGQPRLCEIAMGIDSLTGFLSWLEAAPPQPPKI